MVVSSKCWLVGATHRKNTGKFCDPYCLVAGVVAEASAPLNVIGLVRNRSLHIKCLPYAVVSTQCHACLASKSRIVYKKHNCMFISSHCLSMVVTFLYSKQSHYLFRFKGILSTYLRTDLTCYKSFIDLRSLRRFISILC